MDNDAIHRLKYGDKEVVLIGTAHVSRESADLVERVILDERPDTVCLELCRSRYQSITQKKKWEETDLLKAIREKKASLLLANLMMASFQKRIAKKLGIEPGAEIMSAIKAAEETGAQTHLADRDIRTTLSRAWRLMSFWKKIKLPAQIVLSMGDMDDLSEDRVEEMKKSDVLENLMAEVGKEMPEVRTVLIDERDRYLTKKIREAPGSRIVAVVGAGHVPGIIRNWKQDFSIDELEIVPPKGRMGKIIAWGIPLAIAAMIAFGFASGGSQGGSEMLFWWVGANAILAALGAAVALAHPLTIISAAVAAPFTSLNPLVAAGWVAGLVEVFLGKPKVKDFESLSQDITTVKGFWHNKITRILLVVVFTNLGSSIGTFVAIPLMTKALS
ncbi:MAG: TraB family protein [Deltaproteobacteria bacterium CG_4_8_14_3_um_filter_51_11]|nr:TraB/GumN family protein [bacterium]OIP43679.1 MAG: conjugal transfer protein TraB [Desulfobacteraceae bacterium CG2_30_51_40]PIP46853.1 MAG: conjugal transfer protein TraB [Deltaproteobacteria bacterium CG23_combo_of_CG06-09_8_20_14_all_51_20]PIW00274.1 MAG: TraB family protein [Deltaproteobacteria bacterium CG17_big_fil_post_rev_8_21_14_2_50_51_6]PIX19928.1 MAG: TraB family protein [Deltaproteobacteria bacterium CG_4_8_14_3_um_filter_51_11]PIY26242.1 MAG: TraB family protein [Deltaproteob